jgi:hypothetical protein
VGKCERLWKTVAEELIDRAHPEDLEETRERLRHYFQHYNHLRPHQGLGGMTPADRFFGVEEQVRREVEGAQADNALRLALGERPVSRSFLVGNFDGQPVAVRSGKDGLVIETVPAMTGGKGRTHDDHDDAGEEDAEVREEDALRDAAAAGGGGAGALGAGGGGGAEEGARDGRGDAALLAGEDDEDGGFDGAEGDGTAPVAVEPDGGVGDGGGAPEAAAVAEGTAALGGDHAQEEGGDAREGAQPDAGAGEDSPADAGLEGTGACVGAARSGTQSGETGGPGEGPSPE